MGGEMSDHETHCYELVADCRLRAATDLFAHTWDPVALAALRTGPRRRRELRAAIGGIRDKVLTRRCTGCSPTAWSTAAPTPKPHLASNTA
jgi:DNA-binding HxlR family transcriptional regulator